MIPIIGATSQKSEVIPNRFRVYMDKAIADIKGLSGIVWKHQNHQSCILLDPTTKMHPSAAVGTASLSYTDDGRAFVCVPHANDIGSYDIELWSYSLARDVRLVSATPILMNIYSPF